MLRMERLLKTDGATMPSMSELDAMQAQAEKIRTSQVLGRSGVLLRLFEFLLQQSLAGRRPKELEIAIEVFGKSADFEVAQDAIVRVYIHKLRRKLEEHYAAAGAAEPARLVIPKGEYRLAVEPTPRLLEPAAAPAPAAKPARSRMRWISAALMISLLANTILLAAYVTDSRRAANEYRGVRDQPAWTSLLDDDRPIYVAVGDYFIFGEAGESMNLRRLIREFDINSRADLQQYLYEHPELADRYVDLDLAYLPIATAFALRDLMPILASRGKPVEVVLASDLSAQMLKSGHIVYVGYLSGMGMLQDLVFAKSRFKIGQTYDELVDKVGKRNYISQGGAAASGEVLYRDYGYLSSFTGPNGNQILIVAGTRDVAVMHSAEVLTKAAKLHELTQATASAPGFEALYEVSGIDRTNVSGRLLTAAALDTTSPQTRQDSNRR